MSKSPSQASSIWLSLMEYAMKKGVSLSTLRRHIKADKVVYKVEDGRYLLLWDESSPQESRNSHSVHVAKIGRLERDLQKAHEEIADLKTLIALYEEKI